MIRLILDLGIEAVGLHFRHHTGEADDIGAHRHAVALAVHQHGGMYVRTIRIPAGVAITGALIKVSTVLIFNGHASLFNDGEAVELCGYHVIPAFRGRKQVFLAHTDTDLSMLFPSTAKSVEEAEEAFTDEADRLISRLDPKTNSMMITGE